LKVFRGEKEALYFLNNYEFDDIVAVQFNGNSDAVWGISPPSRENLIEELNSSSPVSIRFSWTVLRENPNPSGGNMAKDKTEVDLAKEGQVRAQLIEMINGTSNSTESLKVIIKHLFPKFLKVSNSGKAVVAESLRKSKLTAEPALHLVYV
jgi:hypothetical protein